MRDPPHRETLEFEPVGWHAARTGENAMLLNKPRAYAVMDRHGLDGLIAATRQNVYYLSDFW